MTVITNDTTVPVGGHFAAVDQDSGRRGSLGNNDVEHLTPVDRLKSDWKNKKTELQNVKTGENRSKRNAMIALACTIGVLILGVIAIAVTMGFFSAPLAALIPALKGSLAQITVIGSAAHQGILFGGAALAGGGVLASIGIGISLLMGHKSKQSEKLALEINDLEVEIAKLEQPSSTSVDAALAAADAAVMMAARARDDVQNLTAEVGVLKDQMKEESSTITTGASSGDVDVNNQIAPDAETPNS